MAAGEPGQPSTAGGEGAEPTPVALQLQVLATEHWGLLATRSLAWTESFTRAGMFLSALAGAIVALALVAQATEFGDEFALFALVILPVVLYIGVSTFVRIGRSNNYDALCVVGMNRIRHAYLEIAPEVEPYLVMGTHDDAAGIGQTMGDLGGGPNFAVDILIGTPTVLAAINSVLGGVIAAVIAEQLGMATVPTLVLAIVVAVAVFGLHVLVAVREIANVVRAYEPKFPAPGS
jgi:hypothetical protein